MRMSLKSGGLWALTVVLSVVSSLAIATVCSGAPAEPFDPGFEQLDIGMAPASSPVPDSRVHVLFEPVQASRSQPATLRH
jgi:hypothetical protein